MKFVAILQDIRFIQQANASMTNMKHSRATVAKSFLKSVFLNFLSIRKDYYKPQHYPLKPPT